MSASIKGILLCLIMGLCVVSGAPCPAQADEEPVRLCLNLAEQTLYLYKGDVCEASYQVAIGKPSAPTPTGDFTIVLKQIDPWWIPEPGAKPVPPGPENPLGCRWLGLDMPGYGIHGTNAPSSIGHAVSKGCIRMHNEDVEALYELVEVETPVSIIYRRLSIDKGFGLPHLTLHPDIYGVEPITAGTLAVALLEAGLSLPPPVMLQHIVEEASTRTVRYILQKRYSLVVINGSWESPGGIGLSEENPLTDTWVGGATASSPGLTNGWSCVLRRRAQTAKEVFSCGRRTRFSLRGLGKGILLPSRS